MDHKKKGRHMEIIDNLLRQLKIEDEIERKNLRLKIMLYSFERATAKLTDRLTEEEKSTIQSFYDQPKPEYEEKIRAIFSQPSYQDVLVQCVLEVIKELMDDPSIVKPEERDTILTNLENSLAQAA